MYDVEHWQSSVSHLIDSAERVSGYTAESYSTYDDLISNFQADVADKLAAIALGRRMLDLDAQLDKESNE
jgi:hypothetical protein